MANSYQYSFTQPDGRVVQFNQPSSLEEYDSLISSGVHPLTLILILFSKSIDLPDGSRRKVFAHWTKQRFRLLRDTYPADVLAAHCRELVCEYWAGYDFRNPIGLLIHRITRSADSTSAQF